MNGYGIWVVALVWFIDGLALSLMFFLSYKTWQRFDNVAGAKQLTPEDHHEKATAWHLLAAIGFIGFAASLSTGMLINAVFIIWPMIFFLVLLVLGFAIAEDQKRIAYRKTPGR